MSMRDPLSYSIPEARTGGARIRAPQHVSPRLLDWVLNGVPVYIRRRPADGVPYATTYDFSKFLTEAPLETVRVQIAKDTPKEFDPCTAPSVLKALEKHRVKAE